MASLERQRLQEKLEECRLEHRDLDEAILRITQAAVHDMIALQRMKKRKLVLKDVMIKLESMLIDDIIA